MVESEQIRPPDSGLTWQTFGIAFALHVVVFLSIWGAGWIFSREEEKKDEEIVPIDLTIVPPWAKKTDDPNPDPKPPPPKVEQQKKPKPPPPKEKVKNEVVDFIKANDPAQAAIREAEEKKRKAAADIIKYLQRKDKPNTPKRIEGMKAKFAELKELIGEEEANTYLPVLNAAIEDCEKNVVPAQEAEKARKEAEKKAKKESAKKK